MIQTKDLWKFMYWPKSGTDNYGEEYYRSKLDSSYFFTIFDNKTNSQIGSIGYGSISLEHLSLGIRKAWLSLVGEVIEKALNPQSWMLRML